MKRGSPLQIVLLPGLLCDASIWADQVAALEPHAMSPWRIFPIMTSIGRNGRRGLVAEEGPIVVIGHSMGARAALEMVRLAPERIERLGLIDTGIHPAGRARRRTGRFLSISPSTRAWARWRAMAAAHGS